MCNLGQDQRELKQYVRVCVRSETPPPQRKPCKRKWPKLPTSEIRHRDPIYSHLIWVCIAIGLHSFSLYCHNDTLEALGRPEDIFHDNSIQLKQYLPSTFLRAELQPDIEMLDKKIIRITQELGTADFIVHHIHAFTIHVTLLILSKGVLYARNSRFVSDKLELGFTYPCDGPGRGGTCQISPWDHLFSAVFWMYNCLNVVTFHYFWKMQSDPVILAKMTPPANLRLDRDNLGQNCPKGIRTRALKDRDL